MENLTDPTEVDEGKKGEVEKEKKEEAEETVLDQALSEDAYSLLYTGAKEWMHDTVSCR
jgi:hypothetical protein